MWYFSYNERKGHASRVFWRALSTPRNRPWGRIAFVDFGTFIIFVFGSGYPKEPP